jgi:hypothetical protein
MRLKIFCPWYVFVLNVPKMSVSQLYFCLHHGKTPLYLSLPPSQRLFVPPCLLLTPLRSHLPSPCPLPLLSAPLGSPSAPLPSLCPSKMPSSLHFFPLIFFTTFILKHFSASICVVNIGTYQAGVVKIYVRKNITTFSFIQNLKTSELYCTIRWRDCGRLGDKKVFKLNFPEFFCLYKIKWHCSAGTPPQWKAAIVMTVLTAQ